MSNEPAGERKLPLPARIGLRAVRLATKPVPEQLRAGAGAMIAAVREADKLGALDRFPRTGRVVGAAAEAGQVVFPAPDVTDFLPFGTRTGGKVARSVVKRVARGKHVARARDAVEERARTVITRVTKGREGLAG